MPVQGPADNEKKRSGKEMNGNMQSIAASLYDGGWRASDRQQMIEEYGFSDEEIIDICEALEAFEPVGATYEVRWTVDTVSRLMVFADYDEAREFFHGLCASARNDDIQLMDAEADEILESFRQEVE